MKKKFLIIAPIIAVLTILLVITVCAFCFRHEHEPSERDPIDCMTEAITNDSISDVIKAYPPECREELSRKLSSKTLHNQYETLKKELGGTFSTSYEITDMSIVSDKVKESARKQSASANFSYKMPQIDEMYILRVTYTYKGKYQEETEDSSYYVIKVKDKYYLNDLQCGGNKLYELFK